MKKLLKIMAFALAMSLMTVCAFAADVPSSSDTSTITVENVDAGTVTAYRIVVPVYSENGLTGYEAAEGVTIEDPENPTAEEVTAIASMIESGQIALESVTLNDNGDGSFSGSVGAGTWIILVSDCGSTVYNPMIVSAYYEDASDASSLTTGTVDAEGNFEEGSSVVYAKSTSVTVEKRISEGSGGTNGASYDVGDEVTFTITATIPSYSDSYTDATFEISDTMSDGLDAVSAEDITVTVDGEEVEASEDTYTVSTSGQTFVISFDSDYVLDNGGATVVVTYTTTINENASSAESLSGNTNDVTLTFTNEYDSTTTAEDTVYVYTFNITDELVKVSKGGSVSSDGTDVTVTKALSGAEFTIYTDEDCTAVYTNDIITTGTVTTDEDGYISFEGLSEGTYYIKETSAPDGYSVNDTVYKVVIEATYNEDGTLSSYTVTVTDTSTGDESVNTYNFSYDGDEASITVTQNPVAVVNLKYSSLPSTGDIGAGIFFILSAAALCMGILFIIMKRREARF